jgi:hypothetical protein
MFESMKVADKASVLAQITNSHPMISAYNLEAYNLETISLVDTNTFPPICPHFLTPGF